jgi:ATP-binding cassette subfamily B protein
MGRGRIDDRKAGNFRGTMKKLLKYMSKYKRNFIVVFVFAIASTAATIVGPKMLGEATTKLFEGVVAQISGTGSIDFDAIALILLVTLGLYLLSALFSFVSGWIMANVSTNITYRFRKDISEKINRLPLKYFDSTTQGEVLSRLTNDVDTINQTLSQSLTQIIVSVITVIGVLIMMISISWIMTLVAFVTIPLTLIIMGLIISKSQKFFKQQQDFLGHVNGHVEEMYGGHTVMKSFNGEERSIEKFQGFNETLYDAAWKSSFLMLLGNLPSFQG